MEDSLYLQIKARRGLACMLQLASRHSTSIFRIHEELQFTLVEIPQEVFETLRMICPHGCRFQVANAWENMPCGSGPCQRKVHKIW